jgi:hypothetical protein
MYGHEFKSESDLFGLRCGQMRGHDFTHNSGWYNREGEKLGWGDLSLEDFQHISDGLDENELFIVLSESDSFWNFVTRPGLIGSISEVNPDVNAPGKEYVAEHCMYIIAKGKVYTVTDWGKREDTIQRGDLSMTVLDRDEARQIIA